MGGFIMVNSIKITDYITEDLIDLDLKSKNREGILVELSELLEKSPFNLVLSTYYYQRRRNFYW